MFPCIVRHRYIQSMQCISNYHRHDALEDFQTRKSWKLSTCRWLYLPLPCLKDVCSAGLNRVRDIGWHPVRMMTVYHKVAEIFVVVSKHGMRGAVRRSKWTWKLPQAPFSWASEFGNDRRDKNESLKPRTDMCLFTLIVCWLVGWLVGCCIFCFIVEYDITFTLPLHFWFFGGVVGNFEKSGCLLSHTSGDSERQRGSWT